MRFSPSDIPKILVFSAVKCCGNKPYTTDITPSETIFYR